MAPPDFSELSFGFAFLRELERSFTGGGIFFQAPKFISQALEASAGYDVDVNLHGNPLYIQFKRSDYLKTSRAKEIANKYFPFPPVYRMHLRDKDYYRQHIALADLEQKGHQVIYVTSQIESHGELSRLYRAKRILSDGTAIFSPTEITLPNRHEKHHVSFTSYSSDAFIFSESGYRFRKQFSSRDEKLSGLLRLREIHSDQEEEFEKIYKYLSKEHMLDTSFASRFKNTGVKLSVLLYIYFDTYIFLAKNIAE